MGSAKNDSNVLCLISRNCPNAIIYEKCTRNHFLAKQKFTPKERYILIDTNKHCYYWCENNKIKEEEL